MWKAKGSPQRSAGSLRSQPSRGECRTKAAPGATFSELLQGLHLGGAKKGVGEPRVGLGKILSLALEGVCRVAARKGVCTASSVKGDPASQPGVCRGSEVGLPTLQLPDKSPRFFSGGLVVAGILPTPAFWPSRPLVGRGLACPLQRKEVLSLLPNSSSLPGWGTYHHIWERRCITLLTPSPGTLLVESPASLQILPSLVGKHLEVVLVWDCGQLPGSPCLNLYSGF